jgi:hypothetical protein
MRAAFVGFAGALVVGCATTGSSPQSNGELRDVVQTEGGQMLRTTPDYAIKGRVARPADEAFAGMLLAYQKLGIEATTNDPAGHTIGNASVTVLRRWNGEDLSRFFECGRDAFQTPRADRYRITFSVATTLAAEGTTDTKVQTLVTARGTDPGGNGGDAYCSSTGHLEGLLVKMANQQ